MANFDKYKFQVDTYAPKLKPKTNPEDKDALKTLYSHFTARLNDLDEELEGLGVEKIVITIIKRGGLADE